jgi:hypothetical protein
MTTAALMPHTAVGVVGTLITTLTMLQPAVGMQLLKILMGTGAAAAAVSVVKTLQKDMMEYTSAATAAAAVGTWQAMVMVTCQVNLTSPAAAAAALVPALGAMACPCSSSHSSSNKQVP